MKIIDERRFTFLPQKLWNRLSKEDVNNLRDYRRIYRHYNENDVKIKELQKELKRRKEKNKEYVIKLTNLNSSIDHLRNDFSFSFSIYPKSDKPNYFMCCISRRGRRRSTKNGTLGSSKLITEHLQTYYKGKKSKLDNLKKIGWKRFVMTEVISKEGEIYNRIINELMKNVDGGSFTLNREFLFPIIKKQKGR